MKGAMAGERSQTVRRVPHNGPVRDTVHRSGVVDRPGMGETTM